MPQRREADANYSVLTSIRSQVGKLSAGEARVAEAILDQPYSAVGWSAQELGEQAGTSAATVVRACRRLGFDGLPELRLALARETGWTRVSTPMSAVEPDAVLQTMLNSTASVVASMGEHIDRESFRRAVAAVAGARRLLLICAGPTQVVCRDALFDLISIGRPAEFIGDSVIQSLAASRLQPGDVALAVGISGENELTIDATRNARDAGATVITMTGFPRSPLAQLGEIRLTIASPTLEVATHGTACLVTMLIVLRGLTASIAQQQTASGDSPFESVIGTPEFTQPSRRYRAHP
ncbi:MurR/RpiR family transcriptional regulator [soil metagenome]